MYCSPNHGSYNILIFFRNCKDNQAIYTALHFESLFNIDDIVNVTVSIIIHNCKLSNEILVYAKHKQTRLIGLVLFAKTTH